MATEGARERASSGWLVPAANPRETALFWGAVAAVVLLAFALRAPGLAPPSLYLDDTWVALLAREASLADLLAIRTHHPIGFLALLSFARRVLPGAELSVQLLPFAASLALIPLGASLVRRVTGGIAGGVLAAVLLALNPTLSVYAVRVKPYATDALLSLVLVATTLPCLAGPSPRRLRRLGILAGLAVLVSYPAALVGAVGFAVAFAAAVAGKVEGRKLVRPAAAFLAVAGVLSFFLVYRQANPSLTSYWQGGFVPLGGPHEAFGFVFSRSALVLGSSFPDGWQPLAVLVPLAFASLLVRPETRFAAAFVAALWVSLFAAAALRLYPVDGRTTSFAFPLVALFAAWSVSSVARKAGSTLVREGVPAFLAAAVALTSASRAAYPRVEDARLVRALAAATKPGDAVLLYPHANWSAGYYSGWPVRLVPADYYGARFEARLLRAPSVTLPGLPGYEDRPGVLDPALEGLVSQRPERVLYLATHLEVNCCAAHVHIRNFLGASGYRGERLAVGPGGELLRFTRVLPGPPPGALPGPPRAAESRPAPPSSGPAGP